MTTPTSIGSPQSTGSPTYADIARKAAPLPKPRTAAVERAAAKKFENPPYVQASFASLEKYEWDMLNWNSATPPSTPVEKQLPHKTPEKVRKVCDRHRLNGSPKQDFKDAFLDDAHLPDFIEDYSPYWRK